MNRILIFLLILTTFKLSAQQGGVYFVAVDGDDSNPGTFAQPWATWKKAFLTADAGDTVYIRGGVYYSDTIVYVDSDTYGNSGTSFSNQIVYAGYPPDIALDNFPILDCRMHCDLLPEPYPGGPIYNSGINFYQTQYITLKCLEVRNVFQCEYVAEAGISAQSCANMTYERVKVYNIGTGRGFHQTSGAWNAADSAYYMDVYCPEFNDPDWCSQQDAGSIFPQPDTTRWINCDVWNVMDTLEYPPGNAADCWKVTSYLGNYYEWDGCRAWNYGDDGWDPNYGTAVWKDCWAMASNKYADVEGAEIERNGIKRKGALITGMTPFWQTYMGNDWYNNYKNDSLSRYYNCLILYSAYGIYHGLSADTSDNPRMYNNTAYGCDRGMQNNDYGLSTIPSIWRNNVSFGALHTNAVGMQSDVEIFNAPYEESNNTWRYVNEGGYDNFETNPSFTIDAADFVTLDSTTLVSLFTAPRQADGSLPVERPLMLASDSDLINGGIDVGLPYYGQAPDLGYCEFKLTSGFNMQDTVALSCIVDITYTGGASASATYHWDFDGATVVSGTGQGPYTVEWPSLGIKSVSLYIEESGNVSDTTTNDIYISELTSGFSLQDTAGLSNSVDISYTGNASPSATYNWDFDSATIISGSGQGPYTVEWPSLGDKTVSLCVEEPNYVSDTSINDIYISELTSDFQLQDTACISNCIDIIYTGNASASATYHWDFDNATIMSGSGQGPYEVQWPSLGDKTVSLYVEDPNFTSDTTTNDICISALTSSFELQDFTCISSTVDIIYTGNASDTAIYFWDFNGATIISGSGQGPYTVEWPSVGDKIVSLYVEESSIISDTSTNNIYISSNPDFTIIPSPGDTVTIMDTVTLMGIAASSYLWSTGDATQSIHVYNNNGPGGGNQVYWLTVTNEWGCSSTDSIVIWFEGPTLLKELTNDIEIKVYPNPFNNYVDTEVRVDRKGQYIFEVVDSLGRPFFQELRNLKSGKNKIRLDPIYGYPGIYFLFIKSEGGTYGVKKIIKSSN